MEKELFEKIYDNIYKKSTLEYVLINLQTIREKLDSEKKITKEKADEIVDKYVTSQILKDILKFEIKHYNLSIFSPISLSSLILNVQNITNTAVIVDVTIAIPLIETDIKELAKKIEGKIDKKVIINITVDPKVLGGIVIKRDKYIFDATLRNHLQSYESEWLKSIKKKHKSEEEIE